MKLYSYRIETTVNYSHIEGSIEATCLDDAIQHAKDIIENLKKVFNDPHWHLDNLIEKIPSQ